MSVELLAAVMPIHMVGESHTLAFSNLLFRPSWSKDTFLCRTRYFPTLLAAQYSAGQTLNGGFVAALVAEGILDKDHRPAFMHAEPSAAFLAGVPIMSPPVVFFAGDMDLHQSIFSKIADKFDFKLPDDPFYGVDNSKEMLPFATVREQLTSVMSPFFNAMERLRVAHFGRLMIHCLPPRTPDDVSASRWTSGVLIRASIRAKLTLAANRLIGEFCAKYEIPFIDTWPELTEGGYLRREFELDGVHVNREAALISLDKISTHLFDQTSKVWNPARYKQSLLRADAYTDADDAARSGQWSDVGISVGRVSGEAVESLSRRLSFSLGQENTHARPDWVGWPRAGRPGIALAEPDESALADAAVILGQGDGRAILHAGAEHEMTVTSFRPVRFPPAVSTFHVLPTPLGSRRALLFLATNDRVSFESLDGIGISCPALERGSLVVYDSHRVRFRVGPGQDNLDLVEISLIPRLSGHPFRAVWAGLCDWPADPFQFSVSGMKAFPSFSGSLFRVRAS